MPHRHGQRKMTFQVPAVTFYVTSPVANAKYYGGRERERKISELIVLVFRNEELFLVQDMEFTCVPNVTYCLRKY